MLFDSNRDSTIFSHPAYDLAINLYIFELVILSVFTRKFLQLSFCSFWFIIYRSTFGKANGTSDDANEANGENDHAEKEQKKGCN